jgi:hypothetical protein
MRETFYNDLLFIHKIASICDYFWPPHGERYEKQWKTYNKGLLDFSKVKENSIIYADLFLIDEFNIFNQIKVPFVLVSGEHDVSVPFMDSKKKSDKLFPLLENPYLIKWYSINVDFIHPKLELIPIGIAKHVPTLMDEKNIPSLEESYMAWNVASSHKDVEYFFHNFVNISSVKENFMRLDKKNLYCRMTVGNSVNSFHQFENIRSEALEKLKINGLKDIESKLVYWTEYILELVNYKFCLSLPGKGLDCYRTWEALSMGVIPIVFSTNLDILYENLPVLIVNDFSIITEEFLDEKYKEISSKLNTYDWHKLSASYWVHKIKGELNIRKKISKSENELEKVIQHVRYSLENAANGCSKLNNEILEFPGMSGFKTRHFYNNICSMDNCRYLEIGTWHGSSSISAMYKNNLNGIFIDNYSLFEGNKEIFVEAAEKYKTESKYRLFDENCWDLNLAGLQTVNTYLYDGPHEYKDHYNAIKYYYPLLEENCIVMIDDWSWEDVRNGTMDAFKDLNTNIKFKYEIITEQPHYDYNGKQGWWNGIGIFVIGKN